MLKEDKRGIVKIPLFLVFNGSNNSKKKISLKESFCDLNFFYFMINIVFLFAFLNDFL